MDVFTWANDVKDKLEKEFADRLVFVGLQGSRARGEAREDSDIDLVVLLDHIDGSDLERYRTIIQAMPYSELACGFVGSKDALAAWPRHELFQFYHDTKAKDDAIKAAHIGASGIYHATCHAFVFDGDAANDILKSLFKSAFFTLQALQFIRTGSYPYTKEELAEQLEGDEARILEIGRNWQEHQPTGNKEQLELVNLLLHWSEKILLG